MKQTAFGRYEFPLHAGACLPVGLSGSARADARHWCGHVRLYAEDEMVLSL